ncbi:VWA domain-containing protein [Microbacterium sp. UBA837]|uniref:VWA domain-containing protein n=1 Tax=Microbacterium sp. UBA837 TaxID=1946956 RepID=UPI0025DBD3EA|nr:VWA domain-containing protein [Microbacterium sp. UBA837]
MRSVLTSVMALIAVTIVLGTITGMSPAIARATAGDEIPPTIIILDASGSMIREASPGVTRMEVAKRATVATIDALPNDAEVGLLTFGTGTGNTDAERAAGCQDVKTLSPLQPADVDSLTASVNSVTQSGFTPIGPALRIAMSMLPADQAGNIVLISDGVDTCAPPTSCEVAAELHRDNPLVNINVVAFGVDDDEEAQQQMTCIGGVGGGTAVSASNPDELLSRLKAATLSDRTVLSARGYEGVELGMTLAEVRSTVGEAEIIETYRRNGVVIVVIDCGWGTVELRDDRVYSIVPADTATPNAERFGVGSTLASLEATYGAPVTADTGEVNTVVYQAQPGSRVGYRVTYDPATDTVLTIIVCRCVSSTSATDAGQWEIDFDGIGPLELGMTEAEARDAAPELIETGDGRWEIESIGLLAFTSEGTIESISISRAPSSYATGPPGAFLPHARGMRLGNPSAGLAGAFPGGTYRSYLVAGGTDYLVTDRSGHLLTFTAYGSAGFGDSSIEKTMPGLELTAITVEDATRTLSAATRSGIFG